MTSKQTVPLLAAALLVAAPMAYAAGAGTGTPTTTSSQSAQSAHEMRSAHETKAMHEAKSERPHLWRAELRAEHLAPAQIKAFDDALVPLDKAVATAQKAVGGQAVDADFRHQDERLVYRMHVLKGNDVTPVTVDAMSGKIVEKGRAIPIRDFDQQDRAVLAAIKSASIPLAKAADTATRHGGGKAMAAAPASAKGALNYQVTVVRNGKAQTLEVNAGNGHVA
ncbi:MAG TPA: PepSY domain-containing protein [Alphaproteobacteria bacterium]|nr:PepSY domain-containing protein [Alphaproteobacteria bacterium]